MYKFFREVEQLGIIVSLARDLSFMFCIYFLKAIYSLYNLTNVTAEQIHDKDMMIIVLSKHQNGKGMPNHSFRIR